MNKPQIPIIICIMFLFWNFVAGDLKLSEFHRGLWVRAISIANPASISRVIKLAEELEITDLYVQVVVGGSAYYQSEILPKSEYLIKNYFLPYDPLDSLIKWATPKRVRVYAWVNAMLVWSFEKKPDSLRHIFHTHPEWFLKDIYNKSMIEYSENEWQDAGLEGLYVDPENLEVQKFLTAICQEIITKYSVAGIHLDFIRYPGVFWGIKNETDFLLAGLNKQDLSWLTFIRYPQLSLFNRWVVYNYYLKNRKRQKVITQFLEGLNQTLKESKKDCLFSCAVFANSAFALYQYGQTWWQWQGIVDYVVLMSYTRDVLLYKDFLDNALYHFPDVVMGIGFLWKNMEAEAYYQQELVKNSPAKGICYFDFAAIDTMVDINKLKGDLTIIENSLYKDTSRFFMVNDVFKEIPESEWIQTGRKFVRWAEDLDFAQFLFSLSLNLERDLTRLRLDRTQFLDYIARDVMAFEYLNHHLLKKNPKLIEPPSREIEYAFLKWQNEDSTVVREKARKIKRFDKKKTIYPMAMKPLAKSVFEAKIGEKKLVETRSGIYVFKIKKLRSGDKTVKRENVPEDLIPVYEYWTIKQEFEKLIEKKQ